jgi:cytochrome bd-type quinol oxidase subunit 2
MKKVKSMISKVMVLFAFLGFLSVMYPQVVYSQPNLNQIDQQVQAATTSFKTWAKLAIGVVFFIALIWVVYNVATNHPKAKEMVIGFIVAVVIYAIACAII